MALFPEVEMGRTNPFQGQPYPDIPKWQPETCL